MKQPIYFLLALLMVSMSSCEVIGGIFKAGVWTGIIAVAVVLGLIVFLITRGTRRD
ncbi:phosphatidate cytidylyltransferase [Chitinophaga nivalis]|uniref:Phosphatidate cytidylyltransferase n=1 Tax=Chitinophaga nivalis TaxID=2991709 RepID=A0ABT3IKF2_9BACT|nr:phosphatidate cytidylyltransferase [Chitinophaga nivalis]MCW3465868.1 phosphatidate cytidylyltransferase [Chitinophaga nivalis]MCW3484441.1 phosphatidate cytidylyltransferase [Chitinophaga nivalis]